MPIATESDIGAFLADGTITAFTIDTNVVIGKGGRVRLDGHAVEQIETLIAHPLPLVLTRTVVREVVVRMTEETQGNLNTIKSALERAGHALKFSETARRHWMNEIAGGRPLKQAARESAQERFDAVANTWGYELLDDGRYITGYSVFDDYFDGKPPFGSGRNKHEFPDFFSLKTLDAVAEEQQTCFLVVSADKSGWKEFCEKSDHLYWVEDMTSAVSCLRHATAMPTDETILKQAVVTWIEEDSLAKGRMQTRVADVVGDIRFTASGLPGEGPLQFRDFYKDELIVPRCAPLDEITIAHQEVQDGKEQATIHVPLSLSVYVPSAGPSEETQNPATGFGPEHLDRYPFSVLAVIYVRTPYPHDDIFRLDKDTAAIVEVRPQP